MSISNDIKPRKVFRPGRKSHHTNNIQSEIVKKPETLRELDSLEIEKKESLEDQFFKGYLHDHKPEQTEKPQKKKERKLGKTFLKIFTPKRLTWFFAFVIIVIVVYQNYNDIRTNLKSDFASTTPQSTTSTKTEETSSTNSVSQDTATSTQPSDNTSSSQTQTPITQPANTSDTTQTTEPAAVAKSSINIKVLNGNGITGSADKIADQLKTAGYTVSKVTNAKSFSYSKTYIYYKTGQDATANEIKSLLSSRSCILQNNDSTVSGYDIVVVVGKS